MGISRRKQPLDFEYVEFVNHVFKLEKHLCSLKQAPRDWYERLNKILLDDNFTKGKLIILFLRKLTKIIC